MRFPAHKTKIVCTIGPASDKEKVLERMILRGMNVARLNFAHGDFASHEQAILRIRAAAKKLFQRVAILAEPAVGERPSVLFNNRSTTGKSLGISGSEDVEKSKSIPPLPGLNCQAQPVRPPDLALGPNHALAGVQPRRNHKG